MQQVNAVCSNAGTQQHNAVVAGLPNNPVGAMADVAQVYAGAYDGISRLSRPADGRVTRFMGDLGSVSQAQAQLAAAMRKAGAYSAQADAAAAARKRFSAASAEVGAQRCVDWMGQ